MAAAIEAGGAEAGAGEPNEPPCCRRVGRSSCRAAAPPSSVSWRVRRVRRSCVLLHGWTATADLNWFSTYEALSAAAPRHRPRPPRPRPGHPVTAAVPARGLRRRRRRPGRRARRRAHRRRSATRWAARSPCSCGAATPSASTGSCCAPRPAVFSSSRQDRAGFVALSGLAMASRLTPPPARSWLGGQILDRRARRPRRLGPRSRSSATTGAPCSRPAPPSGRSRRSRLDRRRRRPDGGDHHDRRPHRAGGPPAAAARVDPRRGRLPVDGDHDVCAVHPERFVPTLISAVANVTGDQRDEEAG